MPSSSLSGRRYRGSYPPYCIPTPPTGPIVPPGAPHYRLQTFARWTDLDPEAPGDQVAYFHLERVGPGNTYFGQSFPSGDRLTIEALQVGSSNYWDVTIEIYDPYRDPETYVWPSILIDPTKPFDTRLLQQIHVTNKDYRYARVTS